MTGADERDVGVIANTTVAGTGDAGPDSLTAQTGNGGTEPIFTQGLARHAGGAVSIGCVAPVLSYRPFSTFAKLNSFSRLFFAANNDNVLQSCRTFAARKQIDSSTKWAMKGNLAPGLLPAPTRKLAQTVPDICCRQPESRQVYRTLSVTVRSTLYL
ncbi:hypothetical protein J6590_042157 [Homalodisca vitripennis]|nr:hypothetical protein J6590_042157 [Homalodisca vitripennis]